MFASVSQPELTKAALLKEFSQHEHSQIKLDEVPWRTLISELKQHNQSKRNVTSPELKFKRLDDDTELHERLESLIQQEKQVNDQIILEQGKLQSYEDLQRDTRESTTDMRRKVFELKELLRLISREQISVMAIDRKAKTESQYLEMEMNRGGQLISKEQKYLKNELITLKTQEKSGKSEVQRTYKHYIHTQQRLEQKQEQVQQTQRIIQQLEYELELKRLAKLDSQLLLMELEEVKLLAQSFLGDKKEVEQHNWLNQGRLQVLQNVEAIAPNTPITELGHILAEKSQSLVEEQFSLTKFLNKLSVFLSFCNNDVGKLISLLLKVYQFESIFDISLKNRYDDVNERINELKLHLAELDSLLVGLKSESETTQMYGNLAQAIDVSIEALSENSLNLLEFRFDVNARERTQQAQRVIWRVLTFLTNGMYRWVDMIKNLGKLVQSSNNPMMKLCEDVNVLDGELFEAESKRTVTILQLIDTHIRGPACPELTHQKAIIFAFIKNDFILFNWGSLDAIGDMLRRKGLEFQAYLPADECPINLIKGLSTFICLEFRSLAKEASESFQVVFTGLLNRFVTIFKGIRQLLNPQVNIRGSLVVQADRRESLLSSARRSEEGKSPKAVNKPPASVRGLFGQTVDFKKQALLRKCQQYQYYFDEKGASNSKRSMIEAVFDSIFDLGRQDDPADQEHEHGHIDTLYHSTRQEIFDQQQCNVEARREQLQLVEMKQQQKFKNYMEKSNRAQYREKEMFTLVKLNQKILKASRNTKSQQYDIVNQLQRTYSTFHGLRTKRGNTNSTMMHKNNITLKSPRVANKTSISMEKRLPTLKTEESLVRKKTSTQSTPILKPLIPQLNLNMKSVLELSPSPRSVLVPHIHSTFYRARYLTESSQHS